MLRVIKASHLLEDENERCESTSSEEREEDGTRFSSVEAMLLDEDDRDSFDE